MKKEIWLLGVLGLIMVVLLAILFFAPAKQNPQLVNNDIQITLPKANAEVSSPLKITGVVNGNGWSGFEGQVGTVKLLDDRFLEGKGQEMAFGILTATTDWMTLPTNFETVLNFPTNGAKSGTLIFYNENPSGDPSKLKTFSLPVKFSDNETTEVEVFFGNLALSSSSEQNECQRVYKTNRYIGETTAVAKAAIDELLKGVTDAERATGFFTSIPAGSKLNSISIVNGQARADFNAITESGGGSCSMAARVAQITQTLMQFPSVISVKLSVDGRTGDVIFQP